MVSGRLAAGTSLGKSARAWTGWLEAGRELSWELPITSGDACTSSAWHSSLPQALPAQRWAAAPHLTGCLWSVNRQSSTFDRQSPAQQQHRCLRGFNAGSSSSSNNSNTFEVAQLAGRNAGEGPRTPELADLSALAHDWRHQSRSVAQSRRSKGENAFSDDDKGAAGVLHAATPAAARSSIPLPLIERTCYLLDQRLRTRAFGCPAERAGARHGSPLSPGICDAHIDASIYRAATEELADIIASVASCMSGGGRLPLQPPPPPDLARSLVSAATATVHTATWPQAARMLHGLVHMRTLGKRFLDRILSRTQRLMVPEPALGARSYACTRPGASARQRGTARVATPGVAAAAATPSVPDDMPSAADAISLLRSLSMLHALPAINASANIGGAMQRLMLYLQACLATLPGPAPLPDLLREVTSCGWRHDREPEFLRRIADYLCVRAPLGTTVAAEPSKLPSGSRATVNRRAAMELGSYDDEDGALARQPRLHALTPSQVVNVLDIYARAGVHHSGLMEHGLDAMERCLPSLTPSQAVRVAEACARLSHHRPALMRLLALHLAAHLSLPALPLPAAGGLPVAPRDVAAMVAALARCRVRDERFLDAVVAYAEAHAGVLLATEAQFGARAWLETQPQEQLLPHAQVAAPGGEVAWGLKKEAPRAPTRPDADGEADASRGGAAVWRWGAAASQPGALGSAASRPHLEPDVEVSEAASLQPELDLHSGAEGSSLAAISISVSNVLSSETMRAVKLMPGDSAARELLENLGTTGVGEGLSQLRTARAGVQDSSPAPAPDSVPVAASLTGAVAATVDDCPIGGVQAARSEEQLLLLLQPAAAAELALAPAKDSQDSSNTDDVALLEALLTPPAQASAPPPSKLSCPRLVGQCWTSEPAFSLRRPPPGTAHLQPLALRAAGVFSASAGRGNADGRVCHVGMARQGATGSAAAWASAVQPGAVTAQRHGMGQQAVGETAGLGHIDPWGSVAEAHAARVPTVVDSSAQRVNLDRIMPDRTGLFIRRLSPALQPRALLDKLLAVQGASIDLYYMPYDYAAVSRNRPGLGCAFLGVTSPEGVAAIAKRLEAGPVCGGGELAVLEYLPPSNSDALLRALLNPASGYRPPQTDTTSRPVLLYVSGSLRGQVQPVEPRDVEMVDLRRVSGEGNRCNRPPPPALRSHHQQLGRQLYGDSADAAALADARESGSAWVRQSLLDSAPPGPLAEMSCPAASNCSGSSSSSGNSSSNPTEGMLCRRHGPHPGVPLRPHGLLDVPQLALIAHSMAILSHHPRSMLATLGRLMRLLLLPVLRDPRMAAALLPPAADGAAAEPVAAIAAPLASSVPASSAANGPCSPTPLPSRQNGQRNQQYLSPPWLPMPPVKSVIHVLHALASQPSPDPDTFRELADVCADSLSAWAPRCCGDEPGRSRAAGTASCSAGLQGPGCCTAEATPNGRCLDAALSDGTCAPAAPLPPPDVLDVHVRLLAQTLAAAADHGSALYHPRLCDAAAALLRHRLRRMRMRAGCALLQPLVRLRHPPAWQLVAAVAPLLAQDSGRLSAASLVDLAWSCARTGLRDSGSHNQGSHQGQVVRVLAARTRQLRHQLPTASVVQMFWALAAMGYDGCGGGAGDSDGGGGGSSVPGPDLYRQLLQVLLQRYDISARDLLLLQEGLELRRRQQQRQRLHGQADPAADWAAGPAAAGWDHMEYFLRELLYRTGSVEVATAAVGAAAAQAAVAVTAAKQRTRTDVAAMAGSIVGGAATSHNLHFADSHTVVRSAVIVATETEPLGSNVGVASSETTQLADVSLSASSEGNSDGAAAEPTETCTVTGLELKELLCTTPRSWSSLATSFPLQLRQPRGMAETVAEVGTVREAHLAEGTGNPKHDLSIAPCWARAEPATEANAVQVSASEDEAQAATVLPLLLTGSCSLSNLNSCVSHGMNSSLTGGGESVGRTGGDEALVGSERADADTLKAGGLVRQIMIARRGLRLEEADGVLMRLQVPDTVAARARATSVIASRCT